MQSDETVAAACQARPSGYAAATRKEGHAITQVEYPDRDRLIRTGLPVQHGHVVQRNVVADTGQAILEVYGSSNVHQFGGHASPCPNNIFRRRGLLSLKFKMDLIQR